MIILKIHSGPFANLYSFEFTSIVKKVKQMCKLNKRQVDYQAFSPMNLKQLFIRLQLNVVELENHNRNESQYKQ